MYSALLAILSFQLFTSTDLIINSFKPKLKSYFYDLVFILVWDPLFTMYLILIYNFIKFFIYQRWCPDVFLKDSWQSDLQWRVVLGAIATNEYRAPFFAVANDSCFELLVTPSANNQVPGQINNMISWLENKINWM